MKIWIDFINTPQVSFFVPFIREFQRNGHEVLLTCRDSGNTVDLLQQNGLEYHIVGDKVESGGLRKSLSFIGRLFKLNAFIKQYRPDVAASQSSFYQPVIAKLRGIPCLYTNDNEHAMGNLFGFFFATRVILPKALETEAFTQRWPLRSKVSFYPSVKEAIYLSQQVELLSASDQKKNTIYFRPEPWSAQYYEGPTNFFDETLLKLSEEYEVVVLPRDNDQRKHYAQPKFARITVPLQALSLQKIVANCLLFIGAGGSMTRELAVLGIPVVSIYQAELLSVDKYLVDKGLLTVNPEVTYEEIKAIILADSKNPQGHAALNEGKESYSLIQNLIGSLAH